MAITTEYDAKVNLTVAKAALAKGKKDKRSADEIKRLRKHVVDAELLLKKIQDALKKSKKG